MISYWLAQFLSRDNKTSARNKKNLFQQPKKPWKKDSTRCLHLSTRVNGYLKLFYFEQATVIANRVGYAVFFFFFFLFLHVSLEMLQHQYIDVNSEVDNATTTMTLERGRATLNLIHSSAPTTCHAKNSNQNETENFGRSYQMPALRHDFSSQSHKNLTCQVSTRFTKHTQLTWSQQANLLVMASVRLPISSSSP